MRNLLEYPITAQEKLDLLTELRNDILGECRIGDMRPLLLKEIAVDVAARAEARPAPAVDREAVARAIGSYVVYDDKGGPDDETLHDVIGGDYVEATRRVYELTDRVLALLSPAVAPPSRDNAGVRP